MKSRPPRARNATSSSTHFSQSAGLSFEMISEVSLRCWAEYEDITRGYGVSNEGSATSHFLSRVPGAVWEKIVIAKRAVAIQLDCVVVPQSGTPRNDRIPKQPLRRDWLSRPLKLERCPQCEEPALRRDPRRDAAVGLCHHGHEFVLIE